jgi:hypothetical protein
VAGQQFALVRFFETAWGEVVYFRGWEFAGNDRKDVPQGLKPSSEQSVSARLKTTFKPFRTIMGRIRVVFITLGEPLAHGDTAEAVPFVERRFSIGEEPQVSPLRYPGFAVVIGGVGELHAAFLTESRTRGRF